MKTREITCINLVLTDRCNRMCPECCCDVPRIREHWETNWLELEAWAKHLRGIERVQLTGGEPTMHPRFWAWAPCLRDLFGCKLLTIETNGFGFRHRPSMFTEFSDVYFTHYAPPEFQDDNGAEFTFLESFLRGIGSRTRLHHIDISHTPRARRGGGTCGRGTGETVALYRGRLYPCCMGWGIPGATSCEVGPLWREDLAAIKLPCEKCFFSGL